MKKIPILVFTILIICAFSLTVFATGGGEEEKNVFEAAFDAFTAHLDEILSALTLVGSVIIAFTYKKGLLPRLGNALSGVSDSVSEINDKTEQSIENAKNVMDRVSTEIENVGNLFATLSQKVDTLAERLTFAESERKSGENMKIIMRAQVDMLYDIFMTSALPQYSKDAIGEKIAKMKERLAESECESERANA